jgi:hypothetical protein
VASVRERTILNERPPLVGEVNSNLCRQRVPRGQRDRSLQPYSVSRPEPLLFLPSSSSIVLTRLSGPHSRPTTCQKIWQSRDRTQTSGSIARNSDHYATEAVNINIHMNFIVKYWYSSLELSPYKPESHFTCHKCITLQCCQINDLKKIRKQNIMA